MASFVMVRGANGVPFYVNMDFVRMIRPSKDPEASRLILMKPDGSEEAISVQGTPAEVARIVGENAPERLVSPARGSNTHASAVSE